MASGPFVQAGKVNLPRTLQKNSDLFSCGSRLVAWTTTTCFSQAIVAIIEAGFGCPE